MPLVLAASRSKARADFSVENDRGSIEWGSLPTLLSFHNMRSRSKRGGRGQAIVSQDHQHGRSAVSTYDSYLRESAVATVSECYFARLNLARVPHMVRLLSIQDDQEAAALRP